MKILLFGKNGQVGKSLADEAKNQGVDYISVDRQALDITNELQINNFFEKNHAFDFVINAAAYTNVDGAEEESELAFSSNVHAIQYIAAACKQYDIPLIHLSTDYVFDGEKITDYDECDLPNPKNAYGRTKLAGEETLRETWQKHIILRLSWIFSEFGNNFVKTISNLCDKKDTISVVCDQYGSPTSACSVAEVIISICKKIYADKHQEQYWGIYHYSDFPATNWHQVASYVALLKEHKTGKITKVHSIEAKNYPLKTARPKNSILNNSKIKKVFGINQKLWITEVARIMDLL